jgi:hypothetical protein
MMDPKAPFTVRAFCAANWIDRALGKPRQSVAVEQQGRTLEDILRAIAADREAEKAAKSSATQERAEGDQEG